MKEKINGGAAERTIDRSLFNIYADGVIINEIASGRVIDANPAVLAMHGYTREEFIGMHLTAIMDPNSHHLLAEYVQTVQAGRVFEAQAVHFRKDGSPIHVEWRGTALTYQGQPCLLGTLRDVTRRVDEDRLLREWVEERAYEQATLLEISQELATAIEIKPRFILNHFRNMVDYSKAAFFSVDESLQTTITVNVPGQTDQETPVTVELSEPDELTSIFRNYRPIRIPDVLESDPEAEFVRSFLSGEAEVILKNVRSWMWVPLAVKGRFMGIVGLGHAEVDYFKEHEADLALTLANHAATTLVNIELYEDAQALAVLQERQRLARNLHDAVNQSLFSASLIAEVLPRLWERDPNEARRSLDDLRKLTRGAISEMRMLVAELRPLALADGNVGDLLHQLANAFTGRTNIPVAITINSHDTLSSEIQVALYRISQEALNNIVKHAEASHVRISLEYDTHHVEMHIHDDGRGFDPTRELSGHYGLSMMQERALGINASIQIKSRPGEGTEVILHWPAKTERNPNDR